jgi:hypothetical protein
VELNLANRHQNLRQLLLLRQSMNLDCLEILALSLMYRLLHQVRE